MIQSLASQAQQAFRVRRSHTTTFIRLRGDAPDWVAAMVTEVLSAATASGDGLGVDERKLWYLYQALSEIASERPVQPRNEEPVGDSLDAHELLEWLCSAAGRLHYVDRVLTHYVATPRSAGLALGVLSTARDLERQEVYDAVATALTKRSRLPA